MATVTIFGGAGVLPPLSTPIPTAFVSSIRGVNRRQFSNNTITTSGFIGPDCDTFDGFQTCSADGDYGSCLSSSVTTACNCDHGLQYLDCVSAAIATSSCWGATTLGVNDWDSYQRSWFQDSCSVPPASVMTELPQPTSVQIEYAPIATVVPTGPMSPPPNHASQLSYSGTGQLLAGACTSTSYTLIDGGDTVYYAAFIGCDRSRPECCPWSVSNVAAGAGVGAGAAAPATQTGGGGGGGASPSDSSGSGAGQQGQDIIGAGQFPVPANNGQAVLRGCPDDYYAVSGLCCPNGFFKFTRPIAYQTPCFSSFGAAVTPPPITAGSEGNPTDTSKPTSAIVNVAWAMGYNVTTESPSEGGLPKGATIGIGVGVGAFAIALILATVFVFLRVRRSKKAALHEHENQEQQDMGQPGGHGEQFPGTTYQAGYGSPGSPPPVVVAGLPEKGQYNNVHGGVQQYSDGNWNQGYGGQKEYHQPPPQAYELAQPAEQQPQAYELAQPEVQQAQYRR